MTEEFHGEICGDTWWNPPRNMFSNSDGWLSTCSMSQLVDGGGGGGGGYEMTSLKENDYVCDMVNSVFCPIDLDSTFDTFRFGNSSTSSSTDWNQSNLFFNGIDDQNVELIIKDDINLKIYEMNSNNFMIDNNNVGQWSPPRELTTVSSNSSEDSSTMNSEFISNINTNFPINSSTSYLIQTLFDDDDNDPKLIDQNNKIPMSSNGRDFDDKTLRNIQVSLLNSLSSRSRPISKSKKKLNNRAKDIITKVVNEEVCDSNCNLNEQPLAKRPRIETPCPLPTFKVRKEKLGDRITALQQLVSPFGKTDTASVLHEAIEYIKYLHDQVNALSTPYLKNQIGIQQDFNMSKEKKEHGKDLRSKGLCVMPISSTYPIAQETPVDFWTPTFGTTPLL